MLADAGLRSRRASRGSSCMDQRLYGGEGKLGVVCMEGKANLGCVTLPQAVLTGEGTP